jgi:hypothetical protein
MASNKNILKRVYNLSRVGFWLYLAFVAYIIYEDVRMAVTPPEKDGIQYVSAFMLPVSLKLHNVSDTIIKYHGPESSEIHIQNGFSFTDRKDINRILNDTAYHKTIITNTFHRTNKKDMPIASAPTTANSEVAVKPQSVWMKLLLYIRHYSQPLIALFIVFMVYRSAKLLSEDFAFSQKLSRYIMYIGNAVIIHQCILLFADWLISTRLHNTALMRSDGGLLAREDVFQLSFTTEFNLLYMFLGLCIISLARLLYHGYQLQQENELTI